MDTMMRTELAAVVIGGTLEAIGSAPPPPPSFHFYQLDALPRVLPRDFVPAELVAQEALQQAAAEQCQAAAGPAAAPAAAAAAGAAPLFGEDGPLDCLEACCLQDDLHLFSPAGPTRSLLSWARLPLPLLYEGREFFYPLRQHRLPAAVRQLALNRCADAGWDLCLRHLNLPMLAARSDYTLSLLQLAPAAGEAGASEQAQARSGAAQRRRRRRTRSWGMDEGSSEGGASASSEEEEGEEEEEDEEDEALDDGGGFELRQLATVAHERPSAHCCWQPRLTQRPLVLLRDGSLLEVELRERAEVVEAWRAPPDAVPPRLLGTLQVQPAAQPRTVVLALRDRLSRLDLRGGAASPQQLWRCPQGQHLTAILAAPPPLAGSERGPPVEHLLAAAASTGVPGGGSQLLVFDLRRPDRPVARWQQPGMDRALQEPPSLLRWLPTPDLCTDPAAASAAGPGGGEGTPRWSGLLVAGAPDSGRVVGCQYTARLAGPALLAADGRIEEQPEGLAARAALLQRVQGALERQEVEQTRWRRRQQQGGGPQPQQRQQEEQQQQQEQQEGQAAMQEDGEQAWATADSGHGRAASDREEEDEEAGEEEEEEEEEGESGGEAAAQARPDAEQQEAAAAARRRDALLAEAARLVPEPLRRPPPLPLPRQFLWQPAHTLAVTPLPGPPLLLAAPDAQQPALRERLAAGRLLLQKQQAVAGGAIQVSLLPLPGRRHSARLLGVAATAADWATRRPLPLPLLCSLTPFGDAAVSLLQQTPLAPAEQAAAAAEAARRGAPPPAALLLPAARAAASSGSSDESASEGRGTRAAALPGQQAALLPYVRGVPRPLVAAVAAGELRRCGCCTACLGMGRGCLTVRALDRAGFVTALPHGHRLAAERQLLTVPAGAHGRSVVQLPLHMALAQRLLAEQAQRGAQHGGSAAGTGDQQQQGQPGAQQQQEEQGEAGAAALGAVLRRLRRPISLHELHEAMRLQLQANSYESASSSGDSEGSGESDAETGSSGGEGGGEAAAAAARRLDRQRATVQRRLLRDWLAERRHEQRQQQQQRCEALAALLAGEAAGAAAGAGEGAARGGGAGPRTLAARRQREAQLRGQRKRKSLAAATGSRLEPGSAALEGVLQAAGLLPPRRPRGSAAEAASAAFGAAQQGRQLWPPAARLLPDWAAFRQQVAGAMAAWQQEPGGQGVAGWQLQPRSFAVHPASGTSRPLSTVTAGGQPRGEAGSAAAGGAAPAQGLLLPVQVQGGDAAAAVLLPVPAPGQAPSEPAAAGSGGAADLQLRQPEQAVSLEAAAALQDLRAAWDAAAAAPGT